ncbi:MAG: hypothetical protein N4A53_00370 [Pelagimonas sp.]|jgi:hypothetical protein|nr:hypothetical protein [Pelagimonas sp.]
MTVFAKALSLGGLLCVAAMIPAQASDYTVTKGRLSAYTGPGPVFSFNQSDLNRNGVLDMREIRTAFGKRAQDIIMAFDANADACVTKFEMRAYYDQGLGRPDGVLWERVGR